MDHKRKMMQVVGDSLLKTATIMLIVIITIWIIGIIYLSLQKKSCGAKNGEIRSISKSDSAT